MTLRLLLAGLRHRAPHLLVLTVASAVAAALLVAAHGVGGTVERVAADALETFGPNVLVRPQVGTDVPLSSEALEAIRDVDGVEAAAAVTELGRGSSRRFVAASGEELLSLHPHWELAGDWPRGDEVVVGRRLAATGTPTLLAMPSATEGSELRRISGVLTTGSDLDTAVLVDATSVGIVGFDRVEVRADPARLESTVTAIENRVPGVEARSLARVSVSEAALARRLGTVLLAAAGLALLVAVVTAAGATAAMVERRRGETALLEALGAGPRELGLTIAAELAATALLAVATGAVGGAWIADAAVSRLTAGPVSPDLSWPALGLAAAAVLAVMVVAGMRTYRGVRDVEPAVVLQGHRL